MARQAINHAGKKYGKLTFIQRDYNPPYKDRNAWWICECECGNIVSRVYNQVIRYNSASCGCSEYDHCFKHRLRYEPEYPIWSMMIQRCHNPNNKDYIYYGKRGIKVCNNWRDFKNFYNDMCPRPFKEATIGRIDNDWDYCLDNCHWETRKEQNRNSNNCVIESIEQAKYIQKLYNTTKYTMVDLSNMFEVSINTISNIIHNRTWT